MLLQNFPGVDPHFFGRANFLNSLYILVGNDLLKSAIKTLEHCLYPIPFTLCLPLCPNNLLQFICTVDTTY